MSKPIFSKKLRVLLTCIPLFGILSTLIGSFPIGFVPEDELNYSTGILSIVTPQTPTNYVGLQVDNEDQYLVLSCSYSPFGNGERSSCGDKKFLIPYEGQTVTIGWYELEKFLGSKNEMPQLVSIEKEGEIIRSYEHTAEKIDRIKHGRLYVLGPLLILLVLGFYWFTGKVR